MADSPLTRSKKLLSGELSTADHHPLNIGMGAQLEEITPDIAFIESFCNVIAYRTSEGLLLVDAGSPMHTPGIFEAIRAWSDAPLHTQIFTHGHVDHIYAVRSFEAEQDEPARVIAHEAVPLRFERYEKTNGYNGWINARQFQLPQPLFPAGYRYPDLTYRDSLTIQVGEVELELFHDRGETDDGTWTWDKKNKIVCTGDLFIWASPNCGNPQKAQRYCDEWAAALRKMEALGAETLLPGHGLPIQGADTVRTVLGDTATYLESIFAQTIDAMNAGAPLDEILHSVTAPAELADRPWLQPVYDEPEFIVRNIWRLYGGWHDGNPANLKPAPASSLGAEISELVGGSAKLAERAEALSNAGEHRLASHLAELAFAADPDDAAVNETRAAVYRRRSENETSLMAKGVYSWAQRQSEANLPASDD